MSCISTVRDITRAKCSTSIIKVLLLPTTTTTTTTTTIIITTTTTTTTSNYEYYARCDAIVCVRYMRVCMYVRMYVCIYV